MKSTLQKMLGLGFILVLVIFIVLMFARGRAVQVVSVERVAEQPMEVFGLGTVEARVLSRVGFAVPGILQQVYVDHGERIAAGAALALLDSAAQTARVSKTEAMLAQAQAAAGRAEAQIGRAEALLAQRQQTRARQDALVKRGTISVEAAEDARTAEQVARADLDVARQEQILATAAVADARAQLQIERVQLQQHTLSAPYDALVVERLREPGAVLNPGEAMFTLIDPTSIWALAYVDEAQAGGLALGQSVRVRLRSLPQQEFAAKIARIGIESDRVSEERRVYIQCTQCPEQSYLGEQVEVLITKRIAKDVLLLPQQAVLGLNAADGWVWAVEAGRLVKRTVRVGDRTLNGRLEVLSGVDEDAQIVSEPTADLRADMRVRSVEQAAP